MPWKEKMAYEFLVKSSKHVKNSLISRLEKKFYF